MSLIHLLFDRRHCTSGLLTEHWITLLRPGWLQECWDTVRGTLEWEWDVVCRDVCDVTQRNLGRGFRYASGAHSDRRLDDSDRRLQCPAGTCSSTVSSGPAEADPAGIAATAAVCHAEP